jgi:hypothetical protein
MLSLDSQHLPPIRGLKESLAFENDVVLEEEIWRVL